MYRLKILKELEIKWITGRVIYKTKRVLNKFLFLLILCFSIFLNQASYAYAEDHQDKKLMLGVNVGDQNIGRWLNEHLGEGDSVGIWFGKFKNFKFITNNKLLRSMTGGNYRKIINGLEDLKKNGVDVVIYDLEPGQKSITKDEINNPLKYTRILKKFCEQNNFELGLAPNMKIIRKYGAELAKYADRFLFMSGAAQEKTPEKFRKEMIRRITPIKSSNPDIQVFVQLRTFHQKKGVRPGPFSGSQLMSYAEAIRDYVDGIVVIYSKDTVDVMKEFVLRFKNRY